LRQALHYGDLYNWTDAAPLFAQAEQAFTAVHDERNVLHAKLGRIRTTMEQLSLPETSEYLQTELDSNPILATDKPLRIYALAIKGDIDGELDAAPMRRDWEAVQAIARELDDKKWQNRASGELGFAAFLEGELGAARQQVALALIAATTSNDIGAQIRYYSAIGTALALNGVGDQALGYFDKAEQIAKANPGTGYQYLIYAGRLRALHALDRRTEAESLAGDIIARARADKRHVKLTQSLIEAAELTSERKDYAAAIQQLQEAITLAKDGAFTRLLAAAQYALADVYRESGDIPHAELAATAAAASGQSAGELMLMPKRLLTLGELQIAQGKYEAADRAFDRAESFVDSMLGGVSNISTRSTLINASSELYTQHFALLADRLAKPQRAYEILERARGRVTADLLATRTAAMTPLDLRVDREVSRLRLQLASAKTAARIKELRDRIFLTEQSRWLSPEAAGPFPSAAAPEITLAQVRRALGRNDVLLEYVLAEPRSYCLAVANESFRIVPLPGRGEIESAVDAYLRAIRSRSAAVAEGRRLFGDLLQPLGPLAGKDRLIIVRDGKLHLVPFDGLIDNAGHYLVASNVVTYQPSASTFYLIKTRPRSHTPERMLLAVGGVPYDGNNAVTRTAALRGYGSASLSNLPGSQDEVLAAASAVENPTNTLLIGPPATESAVKSKAGSFNLIHLSVHGMADSKHPERAALMLLADPKAGEDGILQASEIAHLKTAADLVVLSACDTAVGRLQGEEGIANLSRAFLLAGARTVVSTLWSIDDNFSLILMKQFYKHLAEGQSKALALTAAKRDLLQTFGRRAVPYFWAGFTLEGIGDAPLMRARTKEGA
jgi:tetratricopeptide (TPR) repeat protein